ncbi:MAG: SDR family NAD(P)-dependent oxidoreductase [Spirosomataceae bacterium]
MSKTVLITGTSKGIGLALAKAFLAQGYHVIGTCRTGTIPALVHPQAEVLPLDLSNLSSIHAFEEYFITRSIGLDLLINNAGIGPDLDTDRPEAVSFQQTFDVNVTGTTFLTELMVKYLRPNGKIINISSKMGSIDRCELTDSVAYRMSKAALNMYTKILANRLVGSLKVAAVHPGWVRTTISKSNVNGRLSPEQSAQRIIDFSTSDFRNGIFWNVETQAECEW